MDFFSCLQELVFFFFFLVGASKEKYMFPHLLSLTAGLSLLLGCHPCWRTPPELLALFLAERHYLHFQTRVITEHWDKICKNQEYLCNKEHSICVCVWRRIKSLSAGKWKVHLGNQGKSSTTSMCLASQREKLGNSLDTAVNSSNFPRAVHLP